MVHVKELPPQRNLTSLKAKCSNLQVNNVKNNMLFLSKAASIRLRLNALKIYLCQRLTLGEVSFIQLCEMFSYKAYNVLRGHKEDERIFQLVSTPGNNGNVKKYLS